MTHLRPWFVALLLGIGLVAASGQAPARKRGVLEVLDADQYVSVKDVGGGYEIHVFENVPGVLGHRVVEATHDYVIVEDVAGVTQTRIPLYAIKAVKVMKIAGPAEKPAGR